MVKTVTRLTKPINVAWLRVIPMVRLRVRRSAILARLPNDLSALDKSVRRRTA